MEVHEMGDGSVMVSAPKEKEDRKLRSVDICIKENGYVISKSYEMGGDYGYESPKEYVATTPEDVIMYVKKCLGMSDNPGHDY